MPTPFRDPSIVDPSRFVEIPDLRRLYPHLNFAGNSKLRTSGEPVFVTDPIYLADIFNSNDDPNAAFLREKAVVVTGFGGDVEAPVWWKEPFLLVPTSRYDNNRECPIDANQLASEVGCDSASFIFLVVNDEVPSSLQRRIVDVEQQKNGVRLPLPAGPFQFYLEQHTPQSEHQRWPALYRNVVAQFAVTN